MTSSILDIGSGQYPIKGDNVIHADIDKQARHLEVVCDVYYMPFRSDTFSVVHASHILEHLYDPLKALFKLKKVTRKLVIIKVPNASYEDYRHESSSEHLYSWTEATLKHLLEKRFVTVKIQQKLRYKSLSRGSRHKLTTIKFYVTSLFWKTNELIGVCEK